MPTIIKVEYHKKGRRIYGAFIWQDNGVNVYLAFRKHSDIYTDRKGKLSLAMREGFAAWAIDYSTLVAARAKNMKFIGVKLKDTGDMYFTPIERYFDRKLTRTINYTSRGGSLQKILPLKAFKVVRAEPSL